MKSIREISLERLRTRQECRAVSDELVQVVLNRIDKLPLQLQGIAVAMLVSELQAAAKAANTKEE